MTQSIVIDSLRHHCRFIGPAADVAWLSSELRHLSEVHLPSAIDRALDRRLRHWMQAPGIFRIRQLKLKIRLSRKDLDSGRLSDYLAEQLAAGLERQLADKSDNLAYFASQTDYYVQLIADLLSGHQQRLWAYSEYRALRHLDATEAVVQLLLPRFAELPELVDGLHRCQALPRLLGSLQQHQAQRLFQQWSGAEVSAMFSAHTLPNEDPLQLQTLHGDEALQRPTGQPLALASVCALLDHLAGSDLTLPADDLHQYLWALARRCFMGEHASALGALLAPSAEASPASASQVPAQAQPIVMDWLRWTRQSPQRSAYMLRVLDTEARPASPPTAPATAQPAADQVATVPPPALMLSERAGLVLLIPVLISLRLHLSHTNAQLRQALMLAGGEDTEPEPWLLELLPEDKPPPNDWVLPTGWQLGLSAARQAQIAEQQGAAQISELVQAQFAARLSGLQLSSNDYLRRQFLLRSGRIHLDSQNIRVCLASVPLAIVLRMAGLTSWSGKLPWSEQKNLSIEVAL